MKAVYRALEVPIVIYFIPCPWCNKCAPNLTTYIDTIICLHIVIVNSWKTSIACNIITVNVQNFVKYPNKVYMNIIYGDKALKVFTNMFNKVFMCTTRFKIAWTLFLMYTFQTAQIETLWNARAQITRRWVNMSECTNQLPWLSVARWEIMKF